MIFWTLIISRRCNQFCKQDILIITRIHVYSPEASCASVKNLFNHRFRSYHQYHSAHAQGVLDVEY